MFFNYLFGMFDIYLGIGYLNVVVKLEMVILGGGGWLVFEVGFLCFFYLFVVFSISIILGCSSGGVMNFIVGGFISLNG